MNAIHLFSARLVLLALLLSSVFPASASELSSRSSTGGVIQLALGPETAQTEEPQGSFRTTAGMRTFTWTGLVSRYWADPLNWEPTNGPPSGSDAAIIGPGNSVELTDDVSVGKLENAGDLLGYNFNITVNVEGVWSGGSLTVSNLIINTPPPPPDIELPFDLPIDFEMPWPGFDIVGGIKRQVCHIENRGWVRWRGGTNWFAGSHHFVNKGRFDINSDAMLDRLVLLNLGQVNKNGVQEQQLNVTMTNFGTFNVESGWIDFADWPVVSSNTIILGDSARMVMRVGALRGQVELEANSLFDLRQGVIELHGTRVTGPGLLRVIDTGSLTARGIISIDNLEMFGSMVDVVDRLSVLNRFNWTGGMLSGAGVVEIRPGAQLELDGDAQKTLHVRTLDNSGTIIWKGAGPWGGHSGPVIHNRPGATIEAQSSSALTRFNEAVILTNEGTFRSVATGEKTMELTVENTGLFEVASGTLNMTARFNNRAETRLGEDATMNLMLGGTNSGTFQLATNSDVRFTNGPHHFRNGAKFQGDGRGVMVAGVLFVDENLSADHFDILGGQVENHGSLAILKSMKWSGGILSGPGITRLELPATHLSIEGPDQKTLLDHTLENSGTIRWEGAGRWVGHNGPHLLNKSNSLFEAMSDAPLARFNAPMRVDNLGIIRMVPIEAKTVEAVVNNTNGFEVFNGKLLMTGTFNNHGALLVSSNAQVELSLNGTNSGTFVIDDNSVVQFSGEHSLEQGSSIRGGGFARLAGGGLKVDGEIRISNFELSSGQVDCNGALWILGTMRWRDGIVGGPGLTLIDREASLNLEGPGSKLLLMHTLDNRGTINWDGAGNLGSHTFATVNNRAGAIFNALSAAPLTRFSGALVLNNEGSFYKKSAEPKTMEAVVNNTGWFEVENGSLTMTAPHDNDGVGLVRSNAILELSAGGTNSGHFLLEASSSLRFSGSGRFAGSRHLLESGTKIDGAGTAALVNGYLDSTGIVTVENFEILSGEAHHSGQFDVTQSLRWTGGVLSGAGVTRIAASAHLQMEGPGEKAFRARIENSGTASWTGTGNLAGHTGPVFINRPSGIFHIESQGALTRFNNAAVIENEGLMTRTGNAGATSMEVFLRNRGRLDLRRGILQIVGAFTNEASGVVATTISGGIPGEGYSQLNVDGPVQLDGTYRVSLLDGFEPALNQEFPIISGRPLNGSFSSHGLFLPGAQFEPIYSPTSFSLRITNNLALPPLTLGVREVDGLIRLEWPAEYIGQVQLEATTDLRTNLWTEISLAAGTNKITVAATATAQVFRLRAQ